MPSSRIALAALAGAMAPQRARETRVAAAMWGGSISNSARRSSRVPLRPNPSVPSDTYGAGSQRATMSGSAFIQSVAATIGPPSPGSTVVT